MEWNRKKILLVRNDNIGDLICTTPAIEALKKRYPEAQVDIVVNSYNRIAVDGNPSINHIYCYTKPKHEKCLLKKVKAFCEKSKMLWQIYVQKYDCVVILRGGFSPSANLFAKICTHAKVKIGVKNLKGNDPFTHHVSLVEGLHEVEFCYDCLKSLGVENSGEKTRFVVPGDMKNQYARYQDSIIFHISSRIEENRYPKEKILEIVNGLKDHRLLITAEPADHALMDAVCENTHAEGIKTNSFLDMAALLSKAKLFIGLDGGVIHLAPALGVPIVTIVGKTDMRRWHPWGYAEYCVENPQKKASENTPQSVLDTIAPLL